MPLPLSPLPSPPFPCSWRCWNPTLQDPGGSAHAPPSAPYSFPPQFAVLDAEVVTQGTPESAHSQARHSPCPSLLSPLPPSPPQLAVLDADLAILDEIDSGLDIDALRDVAAAVNGLRRDTRSLLMVTHYQRLLDYIAPDVVHIMEAGRIVRTGDISLAAQLEEGGYAALQTA